MTDLIFYTNPMSRGQTVRWMLEEVGHSYEQRLLDYGTTMKAAEYLSVNPMGKVPAIVHKGQVVTEVAAICCYLAEAFPDAGLLPDLSARGDYFRWIFFCAGPVEAAFSNRSAGWEPNVEQQRMFGYGSYDMAISTIGKAVSGKQFIAGDRFSAADLFVGSMLNFMMQFNLLPADPIFENYVAPLRERPAFKRAKKIDEALIAETQATSHA